jgi:hypothetical protein
VLATAALGAASLHCGGSHAKIETAIEQAVRYLADPSHLYSLAGYYFVYSLHRRFDIEAFADVPDRYRSFHAQRADIAHGGDLFERLIDPAFRLPRERLAQVPHPVDRFTIEALYCDQLPVPDGYESMLRAMVAKGGYERTHVALAIAWLGENRCAPHLPALRAEVAEKMAAGVRNDGRFDDLEYESAAFLYYLGRGDLVPRDFPASLLEAQNADGGWAEHWPGVERSNWHPTVFALWVLLASEGRDNGAPMIPPPPQ